MSNTSMSKTVSIQYSFHSMGTTIITFFYCSTQLLKTCPSYQYENLILQIANKAFEILAKYKLTPANKLSEILAKYKSV